MGQSTTFGEGRAPGWKAWLGGIAGAGIAFAIAVITGAGAEQVFLRPGEEVGYAIGYGLGIGVLVWLVLNFTALRGQSGTMRALAFALVVLGGSLGVMQDI